MAKHLESCLAEIGRFRANLNMLEQELRDRRKRLGELLSRTPRPDEPHDDAREVEIEGHKRRIADLDVLHAQVLPELEALLDQCREGEARAPDREREGAALEASLRQTIEDPRYWRDGDPALAQVVSDGFKRLYPDD